MFATLATALLAATTAPSPSPSPSLEWLDRLAPGSAMLVQVGDLGSALMEEDPGAWLGLLKDPEARDALERLGAALDDGAGDMNLLPSSHELLRLLRSFHGAVMAVPDLDRSEALIVLDVDDDFLVQLEVLMESRGVEVADVTVGERSGRVMTRSGEPLMMAFADPAGTLLTLGDRAQCELALEHFGPSLQHQASSTNSWWQRCDRRVADPMVQVFIDLTTLDNTPGSDQLVSQYVDVAYAGVSYGRPGKQAALVGLHAGPDSTFHDILESFHPVDRSFLRSAPEGVLGANFLNADLGALTVSLVELLNELDPPSSQALTGAIGFANATLGADLIDVILPAFSGDMVFIAWEPLKEPGTGLTTWDATKSSVAVGVRDSEVVLQVLETLEPLTGWESTDEGEATVWQIPDAPGGHAILWLDEKLLVLGSSARVAQIVSCSVDEAVPSLLDPSAVEAMEGWEGVMAQNGAALLDMLGSGYGNMVREEGGEPRDDVFLAVRELFLIALGKLSTDQGAVPLSRETINADGFFADILPR